MEFGVLGPLRVWTPRGDIEVGGGRQRRLLCALIANVDQVVSTDRLVEIVFDGVPPAGAQTTLRSYVARLRRALDEGTGDSPIATETPGYVLRVDREAIDAGRFAAAVEAARRQVADRDPMAAVTTLRDALALWRGEPYDEFGYEDWARPEVLRLDELRVAAEEELNEALLASALPEEVVANARRLTELHPLRERLRMQLALALYRTGRHAEALRSLEEFRTTLAEVGLDPSEELLGLGRAIAAQDPALQLAAPPGRALRGYRLGEAIGEGAHGIVYRATQPGVGREVAVKTIRAGLADNPRFIRRFDAEAQLVAHLEHPHIVPLYDYWREPGGAYLVMRLLPGSLAERLANGPMDPERVTRLAAEVGSALAMAHRAGVVHGDIKPSNVLVDADNAYLADFGVAALDGLDGSARQDDESSGYEPPEALSGDPASPASDQYALAILVAHALTGTLPFGTRAIASPHDRIPSIHTRRSSVAAAVDPVLWKASSWDPRRRYPDVGAFVAELTAALEGREPSEFVDPVPSNPYRGLAAFGEADRAVFFGRDDVVDELVNRLSDRDQGRIVTVIGASGSGKSSLVRAGLVPRLREGALPGSEEWLIATMVPGTDPFAELEAALLSIATGDAFADRAELDDIARIVRSAVPSGQTVLLVIDQLEELFTVADDEPARSFLTGLVDALSDPALNLRVAATLRADYYDRPLRHHDFGRLLRDGAVTIVGMSAAELESAIVQPAAIAGVEVEPALATQLVADTIDRPGALPLLQFTMTELYERRSGRVMALASYQELGAVDQALADRADALYGQLPVEDRALAERMFLRLVAVDESGTASRRRIARSELGALDERGGNMEALVNRCANARLLTLDRDPQTRAPTVELAHEALIRHWPRLAGWIADAGAGLRLQRQVADAAAAWDTQGRDNGDVYRGLRLETALQWAAEDPSAASSLEREFLDAGVDQRDLERRRERRRQRGLAGLAIAVAAAIVLGAFGVLQRGEAARQGDVARAVELASASEEMVDLDPNVALLLAIEAVETMSSSGLYLPAVEETLHRAVLNQRGVITAENSENGVARFSPDGERYVALTYPDDGSILQVWSVEERAPIVDLVGHEGAVLDAVFSYNGEWVASTSFDGTVRIWDSHSGEELVALDGPPPGPTVPAFSRDGTLLASNSFPGRIWVWDVATGEVTIKLPAPAGMVGEIGINLEFSPDDRTLAAAYSNDNVPGAVLWDLETAEPLRTFEGHEGQVIDVGFTPDGTRLLTSGTDATVRIWDVATGDELAVFTGHENGEVRDFQISAGGSLVASGGVAEALVWELDTLEVVDRLSGHSGSIDGIDITPDGRYVVTGSWHDQTSRLWDRSTAPVGELFALPGSDALPGAVAYSPDGTQLAATSGEDLVFLDALTGAETDRIEGAGGDGMFGLVYSPDGSQVVAGSWAGADLWNLGTGEHTSVSGAGSPGWDVAFHPGGGAFATATGTGAKAWSEPGAPSGLRSGWTQAVDFSPDGSLVAIAGDAPEPAFFSLVVLDYPAGTTVAGVPVAAAAGGPHVRPIIDLAFSPDGSRLVTVSEDAAGVVWDTQSWEPLVELRGHDGWIVNVAFDPVRDEVATASLDGTVKVWDLETGATRLTFTGEPYSYVSYSPDGRYLAAIGEQGPVRVFMLELDELVDEARSRVTRDWTESECVQFLHTAQCP